MQSTMDDKTRIDFTDPPAYITTPSSYYHTSEKETCSGRRGKALFGYAVAITTALVVVLILGGVYYYRSLDVLQDTIKTFHKVDTSGDKPVDQNIEIDTDKNVVVYRLNGGGMEPGTLAVVDYAKSMSGVYDPKSRRCFLIAGIRKDLIDPQALEDKLEKNLTKPSTIVELHYRVADDYPVSDKSILPSALKKPCAILPVYWLESTDQEHKRIQKRLAADTGKSAPAPAPKDQVGCTTIYRPDGTIIVIC